MCTGVLRCLVLYCTFIFINILCIDFIGTGKMLWSSGSIGTSHIKNERYPIQHSSDACDEHENENIHPNEIFYRDHECMVACWVQNSDMTAWMRTKPYENETWWDFKLILVSGGNSMCYTGNVHLSFVLRNWCIIEMPWKPEMPLTNNSISVLWDQHTSRWFDNRKRFQSPIGPLCTPLLGMFADEIRLKPKIMIN